MDEYQGAKLHIFFITALKGGVVAALSKLIAVAIIPLPRGTLVSRPTT
jgi:hypothetical protein